MNENKTFSIYTLGCKLNFSESSAISRKLIEQGWTVSVHPDWIIVNSCAVTGTAEKKVRNLISKLHRSSLNSKIAVIGCYSELESEKIKYYEGVCLVLGSSNKNLIIDYLLKDDIGLTNDMIFSYSSNDRTRSFLKIQDGCDYFCTYCTVASARGRSRSDTIQHVLLNIEKIVQSDIKEINLTGVNVGTFGQGSDENLYQLLTAIEQQQLIQRVRISSIEPNLLTQEIIEFASKSEIMMPHFHIPLQSGSNEILGLMRRRYPRELFAQRVKNIKEAMPDACIAVDVISGFPSETEENFIDSYDFIAGLPISYLHVFTYSKRPNTPAATMSNQVPEPVKQHRTNLLLELSQQKKETFYKKNIANKVKVLWEHGSLASPKWMYGFSENYIKVKSAYDATLVNTIQEVLLTEENEVRS